MSTTIQKARSTWPGTSAPSKVTKQCTWTERELASLEKLVLIVHKKRLERRGLIGGGA